MTRSEEETHIPSEDSEVHNLFQSSEEVGKQHVGIDNVALAEKLMKGERMLNTNVGSGTNKQGSSEGLYSLLLKSGRAMT